MTRRYLIKRTFRIYPPYFLSLLLFSFLWPTVDNNLGDVVAHALLLQNFSNSYFFGINPAYWSIAVEFQLYLLYIPMIKAITKFGWLPVMALAFVVESSIRTTEAYYLVRYSIEVPRFLSGSPFGFILSWSIGALVAEWCKTGDKISSIKIWHIITTIVVAVAFTFCKLTTTFSFMLFSISAAMTIAWAHKKEVRNRSWCLGPLLSLGVVSYSFYLIHQPILFLVPRMYHHFHISLHPLIVFTTCVCMIVPLSWCSRLARKAVEIPSVNMGYRLRAMRGELRRTDQNTAGLKCSSGSARPAGVTVETRLNWIEKQFVRRY